MKFIFAETQNFIFGCLIIQDLKNYLGNGKAREQLKTFVLIIFKKLYFKPLLVTLVFCILCMYFLNFLTLQFI